MDEAARRMRDVDLARLAALRARREDAALRQARSRSVALQTAEAAQARAVAEVAEREAVRITGEQAIYAGLTSGDAVGISALEERSVALDALGQAVAAARAAEGDFAAATSKALKAHRGALAVHAVRARETRKWDRALDRIRGARRVLAERLDEAEAEDETLMRIGAAKARA